MPGHQFQCCCRDRKRASVDCISGLAWGKRALHFPISSLTRRTTLLPLSIRLCLRHGHICRTVCLNILALCSEHMMRGEGVIALHGRDRRWSGFDCTPGISRTHIHLESRVSSRYAISSQATAASEGAFNYIGCPLASLLCCQLHA